jgi:glycosyltransferase involved in cell wall biosynthesis
MNILINAVSIKEGGSKVVLLRLLQEFIRLRPEYRWYVVVHPSMVPALPQHPTVFPMPVGAAARSPAHLRVWYETSLPRLVRTHHIDLVFSQTNYLPHRRLPCPALLLVQNAGHFSDKFRSLTASDSRGVLQRLVFQATGRWVRRSVRSATRVTVQTAALATEILRDVEMPAERIAVIPHGPGLAAVRKPHSFPAPAIWRIGYVTKVGVQKNFRTLFRSIAQLRARQPVELILTLDERIPEYEKVAAAIGETGIADLVRNYGELAVDDIQGLYDSLDLFVFPSLCESFGFPLVEAMASGLPVLAADIASTREIGGEALEYFGPNDCHALARHLERLMADPGHYNACARRSAERSRRFSWAQSAERNLALIEEMLSAQVLKSASQGTGAMERRI